MIRAILFFALLITTKFLFAQNNYCLRFKSKEVIKKDRTGLDLYKAIMEFHFTIFHTGLCITPGVRNCFVFSNHKTVLSKSWFLVLF